MTYLDYADNLRNFLLRYRAKYGLSQDLLSFKINIAEYSLKSYEEGTAIPHFKNLIKMADYFQVPLDELIGRKIKGKKNGT